MPTCGNISFMESKVVIGNIDSGTCDISKCTAAMKAKATTVASTETKKCTKAKAACCADKAKAKKVAMNTVE